MNRLAVLKLSLLVVFLGWLMIWIMVPTSVYRYKWSPKLTKKFDTKYFEGQGSILLLFTFPAMLMAAFGCLYLHFQNKQGQSCSTRAVRRNPFSFLRLPVAVTAPLGIVTAVELAFLAMFIALLFWSLANYLHTSFSGHLYMDKPDEKIWQAKFRSVSLRLGYVGNICLAFLFFPVTRGSSILPLFGLTFASATKYHIWLGHISMLLFTAHTIGFIIFWAMVNEMSLMLEWSATWVSNVAGEIAMVLALAMWATSFHGVRRKMFELFFYTHHLYSLYMLFYLLHVGAAYFCMILPGIFLFLIDRYLRFLQSRRRARLVSARLLPCGNVELSFSKSAGLYYNPTSILFVNVSSISKLQWHPFTVTSNCNMEPDKLSVVITTQGSWSQKLYYQLSSSADHLEVSVEGPYGPSSSNFLRHELLVMVGGGSGITPFISIIREIIFQGTKPSFQVPKVLLVCAFRSSSYLSMLDLLFPISGAPEKISQVHLQIEAYITREKEHSSSSDEAQKHIRTKWFKSFPSESPVTAVLGANNWLWLGAVIASSFTMFLLLLALVTRYYINPIDKNVDSYYIYPINPKTKSLYHFSYFVLWYIFLVCASVFIASSAVFLFSKKKNAKDEKHIERSEVPTAITSPVSWFYGGDTELESHPYPSLVQATKIHFGARPDLKKILLECKGSGVGVLACGPRKMRHEVAKICSSGLADNLHFESMSFNW